MLIGIRSMGAGPVLPLYDLLSLSVPVQYSFCSTGNQEIGVFSGCLSIVKYYGSLSTQIVRLRIGQEFPVHIGVKRPPGELPPDLYCLLGDPSTNYEQAI
jgi:hypothetical protein